MHEAHPKGKKTNLSTLHVLFVEGWGGGVEGWGETHKYEAGGKKKT